MARHEPRGQRSLVLASLPSQCAVCQDARQVQMAAPGDELSRHTAACPHCSTGAPIPIYIYPMRDETPRGAA
jgi:hypothetical protein